MSSSPKLTQLDLTGPLELFHRVPDAKVNLLWKDLDPVRTTSGMQILRNVKSGVVLVLKPRSRVKAQP